MKRYILLIFLAFAGIAGLSAQKNINATIERIENDKSTQYVAYSENRNPRTHKLYKASKVMVVTESWAKQLREAINRDRKTAVVFQVTDNNRVVEVKFQNGGEDACYTLMRQRNGRWLVTVEIVNRDNAPGRRRSTAADTPTIWVEPVLYTVWI